MTTDFRSSASVGGMKKQKFVWMSTGLATITIAFLAASHGALGCGVPELSQQALKAAGQALSADEAVRASAIRFLREEGPAGLEALFASHRDLINRHTEATFSPVPVAQDENWERLRAALDAVGEQR